MDIKVKDCINNKVKNILLTFCNNNVYSAASVTVSSFSEGRPKDFFINVGSFGKNNQCKVDKNTFFDLASLTKPFVTVPSVLHLIDKQKISWEEPLFSLLETEVPERFKGVDLQSLLCHNSGFSAHNNYWKKLKSLPPGDKKRWLLQEILSGSAEYEQGKDHVYSDLGYILLGFVVETKTGQSLNDYWQTIITAPLQIEDKLFFPVNNKEKKRAACVQTGNCRWSNNELTGLVHDDNCRALGGVGGHAGLFGSTKGVIVLCKEFLRLYHSLKSKIPISQHTFAKACSPVGDSEWSRGFNLPSLSGSSSGQYFSQNSIGHLGFTGVSFWIDLDRQIIVSLLTNRIVKGDDPAGIRKLRPALHDAIMRCLEKEENPPAEGRGI